MPLRVRRIFIGMRRMESAIGNGKVAFGTTEELGHDDLTA